MPCLGLCVKPVAEDRISSPRCPFSIPYRTPFHIANFRLFAFVQFHQNFENAHLGKKDICRNRRGKKIHKKKSGDISQWHKFSPHRPMWVYPREFGRIKNVTVKQELMPDESLTMNENCEADWWSLHSARVITLH